MKRFLTLALVIAIAAGFVACQKGESNSSSNNATTTLQVIKVATDASFPPMEYVDENRNIIGFDIDLLKAIGELVGFTPQFENVSWDGIFISLENGKYDMIASSVSITDERKLKFAFSDPYVNVGQVLVVPATDSKTTKLQELAGKQVGVQIGTTGNNTADAAKVVEVRTYAEIGLAFQDLVNGNLAGVVIDSPVAADYALVNPNFKGKVLIVGDLITAEPYAYTLRMDNTELLAKLNQGISTLRANGGLDAIKAKWGIK